MTSEIFQFIVESNRIENIFTEPTSQQIKRFKDFIYYDDISVSDIEDLIAVFEPRAYLRDRIGMDVRVGKYYPPRGGPHIREKLVYLLDSDLDAYNLHCEYEKLHPFTDCNGRTGRALWAWKHKDLSLGFLHKFYYQSLENYRNCNEKSDCC
jgi:hypothetical protein